MLFLNLSWKLPTRFFVLPKFQFYLISPKASPVGMSQHIGLLVPVYCNICQINIISQYKNLNNIHHNVLHNENMLQFRAKWSKEVRIYMLNAQKIQPSCYTLCSLGVKMTVIKKLGQCLASWKKRIFTIKMTWHHLCSSAPLFWSEMHTLWIFLIYFDENNILWYISQYGHTVDSSVISCQDMVKSHVSRMVAHYTPTVSADIKTRSFLISVTFFSLSN